MCDGIRLPHTRLTLEAMTLTDADPIRSTAEDLGGTELRRQPITDPAAYLDGLDGDVRSALRALGELLVGVVERPARGESADRFTARCLGVTDCGQLLDEDRDLNPVSRLTTALALGEWITTHAEGCEVGPAEESHPPMWTQTEVGDTLYRYPQCLRVHFPAGTLLPDAGCVIGIEAREGFRYHQQISVFVTRQCQDGARAVLDDLAARANELNPYRGRATRATLSNCELQLTVIKLPTALSRETVIVGSEVWREIELGVVAIRDRHELLNAHGLGARRGVLLCGPPGTGKSAVSAVIAAEVVGEFTVIYVDARAGKELLTAVVEEAQHLGGPVLLILEDVDLWCGDRSSGGSGLSELLQAMDIAADARILTLASTNDASTLDKAAIRTGRFDSIVEVRCPNKADAARILTALVAGLPGGTSVDTGAVVAMLPEYTTGSDIREIVRRAVLNADDTGRVTTEAILAEVGSGRYRSVAPAVGMFL